LGKPFLLKKKGSGKITQENKKWFIGLPLTHHKKPIYFRGDESTVIGDERRGWERVGGTTKLINGGITLRGAIKTILQKNG